MFKNYLKDNINKDDMSNKFFWDTVILYKTAKN